MAFIKPMLAQSEQTGVIISITSNDHAYEPKYDGMRAVIEVGRNAIGVLVCLITARSGADKTDQFPEVVAAALTLAKAAKASFILDGEIVAVDANGKPGSFQGIQTRMHVQGHISQAMNAQPCAYVAFDLLELDGVNICDQQWMARRTALNKLLTKGHKVNLGTPTGTIRPGLVAIQDGTEILQQAKDEGWEGLIVKRLKSRYLPGKRCSDWVKLKFKCRQEFVIGGFTDPQNSRTLLGSLQLGVYENGELVHVGAAGTGFTESELVRVHGILAKLETAKSPFKNAPKPKGGVKIHWVTPTLMAECEFCEVSHDDKLRFPVYIGLRDDKDPKEVVWEKKPQFNR